VPGRPPRLVGVSWARIEPTRGAYAEGALDTLAATLRAVRAAGEEPVVVLHAGALPDWVVETHGWLDPDVLAGWSCYVDRVAQRVGVLVRWWTPIRGPLEEAEVYEGEARLALRTMLDAHAAAFLHLHRSQGHGGQPPQVGTIATWARWTGAGLRGRAEAELRSRLGADAWLGVLATGRLAPPFGLVGDLPTGGPALDWIGVDWGGVVALPEGRRLGEDEAARDLTVQRLGGYGKPMLVDGAAPAAGLGVRAVAG